MTTIRPPRPEEAEALAAMADALSAHEGDPTGGFTADHARRDVLAEGAPLRALVAEGAEGLDGFLFWHFAYETAHGARGGFVSDLFVREDARGRGVGRALLRAAARAVKAGGGEFLQLTALRRNAAALAFYGKVMEEDLKVTVFFAAWERFERLCD